MPVQIIQQPQGFLIEGKESGFLLSVNCFERLRRYNSDENPFVRDDAKLRAGFAAAHSAETLITPINLLVQYYRLARRNVLTKEFVDILAPHLDEIRNLPDAALGTVDRVITNFDQLGLDFKVALQRKDPMPEISLSKVLHFIHPRRYWIVDSRIHALLFIWGYEESFRGFGEFLKDLFSDPNINKLETFLRKSDAGQIKDPDLRDTDPPFLKLIDKILWS